MTKIHINPPPSDAKCMRCGKHVSELEPFGGAGDPLVGDFSGAKLVKTFRAMYEGKIPKYEEVDKRETELLKEQNGEYSREVEETLIKEFGEELLEGYYFYQQVKDTVSASWECRDCIIEYPDE